MKITLVSVLLCLAVLTVQAIDLTTISGQTYSNAVIHRVEPDSLVVMISKGIVRIPFVDLSPEIQQQYGYNPTNAAAYTRQREESNQKTAEAAKVAQKKNAERMAQLQSESDARAAAKPVNRPAVIHKDVSEDHEDVTIVIEPRKKFGIGDVFSKSYGSKPKDPVRRIGQ